MAGDWSEVLELVEKVCSFRDAQTIYESLYAHLIMEMVSLGETVIARQILDEQKDLFLHTGNDWYRDLWAVLYEGKMPFTLKKMKENEQVLSIESEACQKSREMLCKLVKNKLQVVEVDRKSADLMKLIL